MTQSVQKVVILGGGTAGWMSAALLQKVVGPIIEVELIESENIGTVGVGEATIPPIKLVNQVLGFNEAEFIKETHATIKLAIKFENWKRQGESYFHTFGSPGKSFAFCHFHHFHKRAVEMGYKEDLWNFDLNYLCCKTGKFAQINAKDPILDLVYAYHFDAALYAKYLRKLAERFGVKRTEGMVDKVKQDKQGNVRSLILNNGKAITGDLFIDCSGFKGMLIQGALGAGFDDWSHWLPCDRAVAVPSTRFEHTAPYTRSIAHSAGWQWQIPLQHRNGNGLVFSSAHLSEQHAIDLLLQQIGSEPLGDPRIIHFKTGRRRKQWHRNVIAVGLSSGFLEPLESTSIHLIQSAIVRLIQLFPHNGINAENVNEYNRQSKIEFEQIRDFLILHYHLNQRDDSQFWRDMKTMDIPHSLERKMALFAESGALFREQNDLFLEPSWLQVMLGQGITPKDYHPIANNMPKDKLFTMLDDILRVKNEPLEKLPTHDDFLTSYCAHLPNIPVPHQHA